MRAWARRSWLIIAGSVVVVLLAGAGAYLVWGPVGLGQGPVSVAFIGSTGTVSATTDTAILVPIAAPRSSAVVIDGIGITGGSGYRPPALTVVFSDPADTCSGIWSRPDNPRFHQKCEPNGVRKLLGRVIPLAPAQRPAAPVPARSSSAQSSSAQSAARRTGDQAADGRAGRATELMIVVAPPSAQTGCWGVGKVTVHYHVGGKHYVAASSELISGCTPAGPPTPSASPTATSSP